MPKENYSSRVYYTLVGNLFRSILSFSSSMLIARALEPDDYGRYTFLIGTFIAFKQFIDFSSSSAFFTFLSKKIRSIKFIKNYWFYVFLQILIPFILIAFIFPAKWLNYLWAGESKSLIILALISVFFQTTVWPISVQMAESIRKTFYVQIVNVLLVFFHFCIILGLWFYGLLAIPFLFSLIAIEWLIASLFLLNIFKSNYKKEYIDNNKVDTNKSIFIEFWIYCGPFIPYAVFNFIHEFGEKWMLQSWGGSVEQAYFGVAAQISSVILLATTSIIRVFWKEISEANANENFLKVKEMYTVATKVLFFISILVSVTLIPWSKEIISILLGDAYLPGSLTLTIMLLYPIHQSLGQINGTIFYATESTRDYVIGNIIFLIISLISTYYVLAPTDFIIPGLNLGSVGVALKLVLLQLIQANIFSWYIYKKLKSKYDFIFQIYWIIYSLLFMFISYSIIDIFSFTNFHIKFFITTIFYFILMFSLALYKPQMIGLSRVVIIKNFKIITSWLKKYV
jgi:O-antigen/teichoic acid export membrane protein